MSKKQTFLILSLIIITAVGVRLISIFNWHGLLFDEIISVSVAKHALGEMWTYLKWEMHPPLHFIYLHFWIKLFGQSEIIIRLSSTLLGILSILSVYFLGKELFKKRSAGIYCAFFTGFIFITTFHSIFARMYMLLFLLAVLSFYFFIKLINTARYKNNYLSWFLYSLTTLLALYTHLTALAIPLIQLLFLLYLKYKNQLNVQIFKFFVFSFSFLVLLYLPWFINFFVHKLKMLNGDAWYIYAKPFDMFFLTVPALFITGYQSSQFVPIAVAFVFLTITAIGFFKIKQIQPRHWQFHTLFDPPKILALLILFMPMIILFVLNLNSLRFYLLSSLGLILLITAGLVNLPQSRRIRIITWLAIIAIILIPTAKVLSLPQMGWQQASTFIEELEQPGDKIITAFSADLLSLQYYYQGNLAIDTFIDPESKKQSIDDLDLVMRTNSVVYVNNDNISQFGELIGDSQRIFFVFGALFGNSYEHFINWFADNGWQRVENFKNKNYNTPQVWLLNRVKRPSRKYWNNN